MTKEEAINQLKIELSMWESDCKSYHKTKEALKMAIKALSEEPCEDAVSRQAVDELSKELVHTTRDKADFLCNFWEKLQKLPPVTPTQRWIPVSERLPEEGKEVLVSGYDTYGKKVAIARYQGEKYGFTCGLVNAWMPLPKPY